MINNDMRLTGIASGLDTDQWVKDLMKVERIPLDKMEQDKQLLEWKRDDYRSINSLLLSLRNSTFDMKLERTYQTKTATSSNSDIVTATVADQNAVDTTYKLKVNQLAEGAFLTSDPLGANAYGEAIASGSSKINTSGSTITLNMNGTNIDVTNNMTVDQFVKAVNDKSASTNVKVSYDKTQNRFFFVSTDTGSQAKVDFTNNAGVVPAEDFILNTLKLDDPVAPGTLANVTGKDALVELNGTALNFSSNQFTVSGVTYTIKQAQNPADQPVGVNVSRDTDGIINKIKNFVDSYNNTIEKINAELTEERYRDYRPLTKEQKDEMSEQEIKLWNEKANSGMLKNDRMVNSLLYDMRNDLYSPVKGASNTKYDQLSEIGISVKQGSYTDKGKLYLDETKLRAALEDDLDAVMELFTKSGSTEGETGIADRLYQSLNNGIKKLGDYAGSSENTYDSSYLGRSIRELDFEMDEFENKLIDIENRYWRQFNEMEKYIDQMNSQGNWLAQQFNGQ